MLLFHVVLHRARGGFVYTGHSCDFSPELFPGDLRDHLLVVQAIERRAFRFTPEQIQAMRIYEHGYLCDLEPDEAPILEDAAERVAADPLGRVTPDHG